MVSKVLLLKVGVCDTKDTTEGHGDEIHEGDRCCGGHNGQGVMVKRDMEVTEVVEDTMDRVSW